MEKPIHPAAVGKVSQIANLFQRKPIEIQPVEQLSAAAAAAAANVAAAAAAATPGGVNTPITVVRTESHSARFNNARALFEKLGVESNCTGAGTKMTRSNSREDNLIELQIERSSSRSGSDRSVSPPKRRSPFPPGCNVANNNANTLANTQLNGGLNALNNSKFIVDSNTKAARLKADNTSGLITNNTAPAVGSAINSLLSASLSDKPEKPERKFNSRELIEKQKKWTSHFTKTKSNRTHSDPNRCDIIRTGPGTTLISGTAIQMKENNSIIMHNNVNHQTTTTTTTTTHMLVAGVLGGGCGGSGSNSMEEQPPSPPMRHSVLPPEIKPRSSHKISSPVKSPPLPPIPAVKPKNISPVKLPTPTKLPAEPPPNKSELSNVAEFLVACKPRKKSLDLIDDVERVTPSSPPSTNSFLYTSSNRASVDSMGGGSGLGSGSGSGSGGGSSNSAASTSASPAASASSRLSSPVHTEDEKQENESTEKAEVESYHNNAINRRNEQDGK